MSDRGDQILAESETETLEKIELFYDKFMSAQHRDHNEAQACINRLRDNAMMWRNHVIRLLNGDMTEEERENLMYDVRLKKLEEEE